MLLHSTIEQIYSDRRHLFKFHTYVYLDTYMRLICNVKLVYRIGPIVYLHKLTKERMYVYMYMYTVTRRRILIASRYVLTITLTISIDVS